MILKPKSLVGNDQEFVSQRIKSTIKIKIFLSRNLLFCTNKAYLDDQGLMKKINNFVMSIFIDTVVVVANVVVSGMVASAGGGGSCYCCCLKFP